MILKELESKEESENDDIRVLFDSMVSKDNIKNTLKAHDNFQKLSSDYGIHLNKEKIMSETHNGELTYE